MWRFGSVTNLDMETKTTQRGFDYKEFEDSKGVKCSIQQSSIATEEAIWFGCDDIPVRFTREQVAELLPTLQQFVLTGELETEKEVEKRGFIATKKPVDIEYVPFERQFHDVIMSWSTPERPIEIAIPRCIDGKAKASITTLEGVHTATEGEDVIIRGIKGEVYPCKKDIFKATYDA